MTAAFVTATGTGIGKTFVTAGLVHHFRRQGRKVEAFKPVVSGFDPKMAETTDPGILLAALGRPVNEEEVARISPWRFAAALSPDMAARQESRTIDFSELVAFSKKADNARGIAFIEGIGGIMVPLDEHHTMLDWMQELRCPAILVAGSYLGTISHTLTALDVLQSRKIRLRAIVIDQTPESSVSHQETAGTIAQFAKSIPTIALPRLANAAEPHPAFERIARAL